METVKLTQAQNYKHDAENNLSYTQMVHKYNRMHYRDLPVNSAGQEIDEESEIHYFKKKSVCGTPIGFFRCRKGKKDP